MRYFIALLLLFVATPAAGYPTLTGDVVCDSTAAHAPPIYNDFSLALAGVTAGETLYVYPGTYREAATMQPQKDFTILGMGTQANTIITPAQSVNEALFSLHGGSIYKATLTNLGFSGTGGDIDVLDFTAGVTLGEAPNLAGLTCPSGRWISNDTLYVYLSGNPVPTSHVLEIVNNQAFGGVGFIHPWDWGVAHDFRIQGVQFRGLTDGRGIYSLAAASASPGGQIFKDVTFSYGLGVQCFWYQGDHGITFDGVILARNYDLQWVREIILCNIEQSVTTPVELDLIMNRVTVNNGALTAPDPSGVPLKTSTSSMVVDSCTVYGAGTDHCGFSVTTGAAASAGTVTLSSSIFASFDRSLPSPQACGTGIYSDAADDYFWTGAGNAVKMTVNHCLFAYSHQNIGLGNAATGSTLSGADNIFINGELIIPTNVAVSTWDNNLYWNSGDPYSALLASIGGVGKTTLAGIQAKWDSIGCSACDDTSLGAAPQMTAWTPRDSTLLSYDFTPTQGGNLCGAGSTGDDIGPLACAAGGNNAPVLAAIGPQSGTASTLLSFNVSATDADSDSLTFSLSGAPAGMAIDDHLDGTATVTWIPGGYAAFKSNPATVIVSDRADSDSETISCSVSCP